MRDEELRDAYVARLGRQQVDRARGECVSPEAMLAVVEDRATEDERIDVLDHAMACPACRPEFEALRAIARVGEEMGATRTDAGAQDAAAPVAAPVTARGAVRPRGWRVPRAFLAAAAAVVVLAGTSVVLRQRGAEADAPVVPGSPAGPEPMRGGADAVAALAPTGAVPRERLTLVWRPVAGASGYAAEVLDAAGRPVYATELRSPSDTALALPDSVRLTPGADYQWWVRARLPDGTERRSEMRGFRVRQ